MSGPASLLLLVALVVGVRPAEAAPLTYTMTLTPDFVGCNGGIQGFVPCVPPFPIDLFNPPPTVGQAYVGSFTLQDSSVLATDGTNLPATLTAFHLTLGNLVWDAFHPGPGNVFSGFRGPRAGDPDCPGGNAATGPPFHPGGPNFLCLGAPSPGFDVVGGQVVGLFGDVFGSSDIPFVDFEGMIGATGRFTANGGAIVMGTMVLAQVSAPPALLLLSAGLGLTGLISEILRQRKGHR